MAAESDGTTTCSNTNFGGDPISMTVKYCWCGLTYFGTAVGSYSNQIVIDVVCGSEAPTVDVASHILPVT